MHKFEIFFDFLWSTEGQNHTNIQYEHDAQPVVPLCSIKVFVCQHSLDRPILRNNEKIHGTQWKNENAKLHKLGKSLSAISQQLQVSTSLVQIVSPLFQGVEEDPYDHHQKRLLGMFMKHRGSSLQWAVGQCYSPTVKPVLYLYELRGCRPRKKPLP